MSEEEKAVRKKTVKKVAKKTTRKVVRKSVAKKTTAKNKEGTPKRKAPTAVVSRSAEDKTNRIVLFAGIGFVSLLLIGSTAIGFMAEGGIEVSTAIQEQREDASPEEIEKIDSIAVQGTKKRLPNGGLTPTPNHGNLPVTKETPKEVPAATSTDEVASSTDPIDDTNTQEVAADVEENTNTETATGTTGMVSDEGIQ